MHIGIIGSQGIVGKALLFGFQKLNHEVIEHDIAKNTKIDDVLICDIVYICVPTPMNQDGSCDTSIVEDVIFSLIEKNFSGIIAIKSTVKPGTTEKLIKETGYADICFVPEFLKERTNIADFIENHKLLAIGTHSDYHYKVVVECHGEYPQCTLRMTSTEAEMLKLVHNTFNALRIVFANECYDVCKALGADYRKVKTGLLKTSGVPDIYLDVNENVAGLRGYGGTCLKKDIPALASLAKELGLGHLELFDTIISENDKYKKSVFDGMRD